MNGNPLDSECYVLGLSCGRCSAVPAFFVRQHRPDLYVNYFFTDSGKELPEVYEYLGGLEGFLGKPIHRLSVDRGFYFWLKQYNNFLPSPQTRWCTCQLKIKTFKERIKRALADGHTVHSYVAIRADEAGRSGIVSKQRNLKGHLPFVEKGLDKTAIIELLDASGLGLPAYYRWRLRSGGTFCFFLQKIEFVRLKEEHPNAYEEVCKYEKVAIENDSPFTWSQRESLDELNRLVRAAQFKSNHERRLARIKKRAVTNPLNPSIEITDLDNIYGNGNKCLACHK